MCGIVGMVATRNVVPILLEGLQRLEYRGYDSAGIAVIGSDQQLLRRRAVGKVNKLQQLLQQQPLQGHTGIAHTRWATHGKPSEHNAHPLLSNQHLAVVHNGIIENHQQFRSSLINEGYQFDSETDTEVVAHYLDHAMAKNQDLLAASLQLMPQLQGAYAMLIMSQTQPEHLIAMRQGCPMVIGIGTGEHFVASDPFALLPVTQTFVYLEDGDIADVYKDQLTIYNNGQIVNRPVRAFNAVYGMAERGEYRHYMQKEIFEQPEAINNTLEGRISDTVLEACFGNAAKDYFDRVEHIQIVACGTSYHAGIVARYWLESLAGISCQVEVASEFRYRQHVILPNTLFITLSQSGETADTLAALRVAKKAGILASLAICNVPESALVREADLTFLTRAGREIGVASTKAFSTQLVAMLLLTLVLARHKGLDKQQEQELVQHLLTTPRLTEEVLKLDKTIQQLARKFADKHHTLFLGRGTMYPIALEGALKLKELSYIHAEAYPAGELKHGPLALVDNDMPIIAIAPSDELLDKLRSNLEEVRARGGQLIIFSDHQATMSNSPDITTIVMPKAASIIAPIIYSIPLQLLAYHVAIIKGTDVDQPRNLAKSVTVE